MIENFETVTRKLRELEDRLRKLEVSDIDLRGRRIKNAAPSVDPDDYVTRREIPQFVQAIPSVAVPQAGASSVEPIPDPEQPTSVNAVVVESKTDPQTGEQYDRVDITLVAPAQQNSYSGVWIYNSITAPDPETERVTEFTKGQSPFFWNGVGTTVSIWIRRDTAARVYWAYGTVSNRRNTIFPTVASAKTSFTINAFNLAAPVLNPVVQVLTDNSTGIDHGKFKWTFTPPNDPQWNWVTIQHRPTTSTFQPIPGFEEFQTVADGIRNSYEQEFFWPRPGFITYQQHRFVSVNKAGLINTVNAPIVNVTIPAGSAVGLPQAPPQLPNDSYINVVVATTRTDPQTGEQYDRVDITLIPPAGTPASAYSGVWIYESLVAPDPAITPVSERTKGQSPFFWNGVGTKVEIWIRRDTTAKTYWAYATISSDIITITPTASFAKKSFVIPAISLAQNSPTFSVLVHTTNNNGEPQGQFEWYNIQIPNDSNFKHFRIDHRAVTSGFQPIPGFDWGIVADGVKTSNYRQTDWWNRPTTVTYQQHRLVPINKANLENLNAALVVNVTIPAGGGVKANMIDTSTITSELTTSQGQLGVSNLSFSKIQSDTVISNGVYQIRSLFSLSSAILSYDVLLFTNPLTQIVVSLGPSGLVLAPNSNSRIEFAPSTPPELRVNYQKVITSRKPAVSGNSIGNAPPFTGTNVADAATGNLYNFLVEVQRQINDIRDRLKASTGHGLIEG